MSTALKEFTWCFDTLNKEEKKGKQYDNNPTNDIDLDVLTSFNSVGTKQIYLGSVELPLGQYAIEHEWQNLHFDEGTAIRVTSSSNQCLQEFSVNVDGVTYTAILPVFNNPIINVVNVGGNLWELTTAFPHGLSVGNEWTWGDPIHLISTPVTDPIEQASFTIVDNVTFQVDTTNSAVTTWTANTTTANFGYLHAPTIPSPTTLANIVTRALVVATNGDQMFTVTFNKDTGQFQFCVTSYSQRRLTYTTLGQDCQLGGVFERQRAEFKSLPSVRLLMPSRMCLPSIMGFGQPPFSHVSVNKNGQQCLIGGAPYKCSDAHITIGVGNYNADTLKTELALQWNRLYFDGGCAQDPNERDTLIFSDNCGTCFTIDIPYGKYTPETFSNFLSQAMTTASLQNYLVTYDSDTKRFTIENTNGMSFGLEFASPTSSTYARLGFHPTCHRGQTRYASDEQVFFPRHLCSSTNSQFQYEVYLNQRTQTYSFHVCKPFCMGDINNSPYQATEPGACPGDVPQNGIILMDQPGGGPQYAHGFQVGDVVTLNNLPGPITSAEFVVLEVCNAFSYLLDMGGLEGAVPGTGLDGATSTGICSCLSGLPCSNFYFEDRSIDCANTIKGEILGFNRRAYCWVDDVLATVSKDCTQQERANLQDTMDPKALTAPKCLNLDPPNYLLLEVTFPTGSTNIQHEFRGSTIQNVFAKIILYPPYRQERIYPMKMDFSSPTKFNRIHMRFLNPDHTLYNFHGKEWSGTIVTLLPDERPELLAK